MVVRRQAAAIALVAMLAVVSGCTGSEPDADQTPAPTSPVPSAEADDAWTQSLCADIDADELAAVFGQDVARRALAGMSSVGIPSYDSCSFVIGSADEGTAATFSWSVESIADDDWDAIARYARDNHGRYTEIEPVDVGEAGYAYANTVVAHVGDRAVRLVVDAPTATQGQLGEALGLAEPGVAELPDPEPVRTLDDCAAVDAEAEAVLGASATIRRDYVDPGTDLVNCGWATRTAAVSVSVTRIDEAGSQLEQSIREFDAEKLDDLGVVAGYFGGEDGRSVQLVTESGTFVQVSVPALLPGERDALIALAAAIAPTY